MSESIDVWILDSSEFELADLEANTISLLSAAGEGSVRAL
jgi:hypothetical protein